MMPLVNLMAPNCQIHYNQITQRKHSNSGIHYNAINNEKSTKP